MATDTTATTATTTDIRIASSRPRCRGRAPVYRPTVVVPAVPAYPQYYYYDPRPSGSIGVYGRKFGFSIGF